MFLFDFFIILLLFYLCYSENKTIFVFEHFRHGARGPIREDTIFNEKYIGMGELTNVGARMHYLLGNRNKFIYKKKKKFISAKFQPDEFLIFSTNTNRTIESVNNQLQGMFSEQTEDLTLIKSQGKKSTPYYLHNNDKIKQKIQLLNNIATNYGTQVFPVHVLNMGNNYIPLFNINNCPKFVDFRNQNIKKITNDINKFMNDFLMNYKSLFSNSDTKQKDKILEKINRICDSTVVGYTDRRQINKVQNINITKLYSDCNYFFKILFTKIYVNDNENKISKITMSHLMNVTLKFMDKRIELDKKNKGDLILKNHPKFFIYSGHDTTISQLQDFLRLIFGSSIIETPFASNLFLEVINKNNSEYFVKFIYNDNTIMEMEYNKFKKKVNENVISNQEILKYCRATQKPIFKILFFILLFCNVLLLLLIIFIKKGNKDEDYKNIVTLSKVTDD